MRQLLDEGEDRVALGLEQRFEVIEDEQRLRATKRIKQHTRAFAFDGLGNVIAAEFASEFVEQFSEAADEKAGEVAQAIVVEFAGLERDEGDFLEGISR